MDRLIYNSKPIPSKFHLNSRPHFPRLAGIAAARLAVPPSSPADSRRVVASLLRKAEIPSFPSPHLASITDKFSKLCPIKASSLSSSSPLDSPDGSNPNPPQIVERSSDRGKAVKENTCCKKLGRAGEQGHVEESKSGFGTLSRRFLRLTERLLEVQFNVIGMLKMLKTLKLAVAAGTAVLLSALVVILIHPFIVSPAFATFQNAAKTRGRVGRLLRAELLSSAWTGFLAGCLHTLSGPDHLAALAPLSIGRTRTESAAVGALWGCGHDAGQLIFGLLFLLLKDRLHIEVIRTWGTRVVGFTLLVIGAMGIREASEVPTTRVAFENGECDVSVYEALVNPGFVKKKKIGFATFATGIVHGLQPDALMMVLPALALPSRLAGAAFLGMFLVDTVFAMGSYTVFIGSCSEALKERIPRITEKLTWASSLVAIALGLAIIISQFFGFSLY
ncbi:high-affinity nickel-transport family protein [Actinidia rufa]|uniref:High-affinity nickel-transport family protein n=1 Tax=Actinidia rufa TaxID=165716 RepID=A0A7J0F7A3_9ERIC|nr:high-affinity nickel-transport family protein [Actinidia rufa]